MNSKRLLQDKQQHNVAPLTTIHLRSVSSTNDYARVLADSGARHGTLVIADIQTRGRGRTGSKWMSPPGGLWMSLILRPESSEERLSLIPLMASLAVTDALKMHGVYARAKWPNDIVLKGRKIVGILCESSVAEERFQWVIVGIGVNVNNPPPTTPVIDSRYQAISMIRVKGEITDLTALANSIRSSTLQHYDSLLEHGERATLDEYNALHTLRNRKVRVSLHDHAVEGVAGEVDSEGSLSLKDSEGSIHKLRSEDVLFVETLK